jgi:hypothetical protein
VRDGQMREEVWRTIRVTVERGRGRGEEGRPGGEGVEGPCKGEGGGLFYGHGLGTSMWEWTRTGSVESGVCGTWDVAGGG